MIRVSLPTFRLLTRAAVVLLALIVVTGGAVRLTGSGLGCPTWPQCGDGSFVTRPEFAHHGLIEFGNRVAQEILVGLRPRDLGLGGSQRRCRVAPGGPGGAQGRDVEAREGVQQQPVAARVQQPAVVLLAVQLDQRVRDRAQHLGRGAAVVHEARLASVGGID
ncbi:MAG: COX15/CtaA family protein, partial [Gammaproteobacteria bacterium]